MITYQLKLRRDCAVSFGSPTVFEGVKKRGLEKKYGLKY